MKKVSKISNWITYTLVAVFTLPIVIFFTADYFSNQKRDFDTKESELASLDKPDERVLVKKKVLTEDDSWEEIFPGTKLMLISDFEVNASVAKTWPERIQGLSGTPYLPENVVKLFVFDAPGLHSIWMKDMKYPIDILWVSDDSEIVHIVKNATPDSYPELFLPEREAYYVIETKAGFVDDKGVEIGDKVILPDLD